MTRRIPLLIAACLFASSVLATTFVVPTDRHMVSAANAIVVGSVQTSFTQLTESRSIETVTEVKIEEVLKGSFDGTSVKVHSPGGIYGDRGMYAVGASRFHDGERVIVFLSETKPNRFFVLNLALGKFGIATDTRGRKVALRQEADINGWTIDGAPHVERRRDAAKFIEFIRNVAHGRAASDDYFVSNTSRLDPAVNARELEVAPQDFSASSYLFDSNARWSSFPRTYTHTNTITGAPNGGVTAITTSIGLWNDDAQSNVSIQHGGLDATKTAGTLGGSDNANAIQWEVNLTSLGAPAYQCGSGGVLGYANIWFGGTHQGPGNLNYLTITEGDVDMNQGLQGCNSAINSNTFTLALTHEIGHTLGFRHADENPDGSQPCAAPNECVPQRPNAPAPDSGPHAVMRSSIANGLSIALQSYDQNAVRAVYPQPVVAVPPAPTGLTATATSTTAVALAWTTSAGATGYKIFRRTTGGTYAQIGTSVATAFSDSTATGLAAGTPYQYVVKATNEGGDSANSNSDITVTVSFTDLMAAGVTIRATHFTELATAINALRDLAGLGTFTFTTPVPAAGVTINKTHMDSLRTALNEARVELGATAVTFTDPTIVASTTAVKATHVTELRNGVL